MSKYQPPGGCPKHLHQPLSKPATHPETSGIEEESKAAYVRDAIPKKRFLKFINGLWTPPILMTKLQKNNIFWNENFWENC